MNEPVATTPNPAGIGRPLVSEEQYAEWLKDLKPHLELACTLRGACVKAGLLDKYESCIWEKYRKKDWFSNKVDAYRASLGESINEALARLTLKTLDRIKREEIVTHDDIDVLKHMSEKHRTAQPFFVTRTETAEAKDDQLGKILDNLESKTDYAKLGQEARRQMVANDPSVQDQGQSGPTGSIPAQPNAAVAPTGTPSA